MDPSADLFNEGKLTHILELMKNRREIDHPINYDAIRETSVLLVDGILIKLLEYILSAIDTVNYSKILETTEANADTTKRNNPLEGGSNGNNNNGNHPKTASGPTVMHGKLEQLNWDLLKLSAEIIFFALYQTQIEIEEAKLLLEVIYSLSDLLSKTIDDFSTSSLTSQAIATVVATDNNAAIASTSPIYIKNQITTSFLYILIVLQLSHVCAHQQIAKLLSRRKNYYNRKSFDHGEPGNILPQKRHSKYGLDKHNWKCSGVKGFTNLVFAVFRQPEVDEGKIPKEDVEWFMHEACVLRGYSYIRLCLLPIIRTSSIVRYEYCLFFTAVLAELLENLAKVFVFSHYDHNENDFPYIFFPPTMDFYIQNIHFYQGVLEEYEHSRISPYKRTPNNPVMTMMIGNMSSGYDTSFSSALIMDVDTLQDVLNLYIDLLQYYPSFATIFWGELDSEIGTEERSGGDEGENEEEEALTNSRVHPALHEFHPFITKVIESTQHHRHLLLDTLRLLTALGNGPKGCTARLVYFLISEGFLNRMDWDRIVDKITRFINEFIVEDTHNLHLGIATGRGTASNAVVNRSISPVDLEGILVFIELIGMISIRKSVATHFVKHYQILPKLFSLLSCPIPIEIKGQVLSTISKIAKFPRFHSILWELLDNSGLLTSLFIPTISNPNEVRATGGGSNFYHHTQHYSRGIKAELEENESRTGRYPITLGFLQLIRNLFQYYHPTESEINLQTLGNGYRIPGILPYLEYIIEDIYMKIHDRYYFPEDSLNVISQRWRLTAYCLEIFSLLLQQLYPIHQYNQQQFLQRLFSSPDPTRLNSKYAEPSTSEDSVIDQYINDFKEEYVTIETKSNALVLSGVVKAAQQQLPQKYKVPKTPGFYLLSTILNNSKFTELLMKILTTIDSNYLLQGLKSYTMNEFLTIFEVYKYGFVHSKLRSRLHHLFLMKDRFLPYVSAQYYAGSGFEPSSLLSGEAGDFHLSDAKFDPFATNTVFWLERALTNALILFYEILIRENSFRFYLKNCHQTLYLTKFDTFKRLTNPIPVHPYPFLDIITGYGLTNKLIELIPLDFLTLPSIPLPNIIIVKILEQILLQKPFYSMITSSTENLFGGGGGERKSSVASTTTIGGFQQALNDSKKILESFSSRILHEKDYPTYLYDEYRFVDSHYNVFYIGGERAPVIPSTFFSIRGDGNNSLISSTSTNSIYGSMRHAILSMILNTLVTSNSTTFNHHLLGFGNTTNPFGTSTTTAFFLPPSLLSSSESITGPKDCFTAMLQVISPNQQKIDHFFLRHPDQSLMIYELLYRLSSSSSVGKVTLQRLHQERKAHHLQQQQNQSAHHFLFEHFTYFFHLLTLSKEELVKLLFEIDVFSFPDQTTAGDISPEESLQQKILLKLYDIHTAINHSLAYLFKIFNCELATIFLRNPLQIYDTTINQTYPTIKAIIDLSFYQFSVLSVANSKGSIGGYEDGRDYASRESEEKMNILQCLYYAFHEEELLSLPASLTQSISALANHSQKRLPVVLQILKQSMIVQSSSSRLFSDNTIFPAAVENDSIACPFYRCIDISDCIGKIQEHFQFPASGTTAIVGGRTATGNEEVSKEIAAIIENAIKLSILFNQQEKLQASRNHLLLAFRQLIDCSFLSNASVASNIPGIGSNGFSPILKAFSELQSSNSTSANPSASGSSSSNIIDVKLYLFIELLLPLIKFFKAHSDEIPTLSIKLSSVKSILTVLSFVSSSSSSSPPLIIDNISTKEERKIAIFAFTWKEIIDNLYHLLLLSSTSSSNQNYSLISQQQNSHLKVLLNTLNSRLNDSATQTGDVAGSMTLRGYLAVTLQLAMKIISHSDSFTSNRTLKGLKSVVLQSSLTTSSSRLNGGGTSAYDSSLSEEKKAYSPTSSGLNQSNDVHQQDMIRHLQTLLQQNALPLIELLVPVATDGPLQLRMNGIHTLAYIFSILSNHSDEGRIDNITPLGYLLKLLHLLAQKGYLSLLLQRSIATTDFNQKEQSVMYLTTLQFFHQLVRSIGGSSGGRGNGLTYANNGVSSLFLECGLIEQISYSELFPQVTTQLLLLIASSNSTSANASSSLLEDYAAVFQETLSFFTTLLSSSSPSTPLDKAMVQTILHFYLRHREIISQFIHQAYQCFVQLECLESITAFLFLLLDQIILLSDSQEKIEERYSSNYLKLSQLLTKDLDILLSDCFHILQIIGEKPIPFSLVEYYHQSKLSNYHQTNPTQMKLLVQLKQRQHLYSSSSNSTNWWEVIVPLSSSEKIWKTQLLAQLSPERTEFSSTAGSAASSDSNTAIFLVPNQWTVFDQIKLEKSYNIVFHLLNILRVISLPDQRLFTSSSSSTDPTGKKSSISGLIVNEKKLFHLPLLVHIFHESVIVMTQLQYFHDGLQTNSVNNAPPTHSLTKLLTKEQRFQWLSSYKYLPELSSAVQNHSATNGNNNTSSLTVSTFIQSKAMMIAENAIITIYHVLTNSIHKGSTNGDRSSGFTYSGLTEEDKQLLTFLFQLNELLPDRSFCRMVLRWIYEELVVVNP